MYVCVCVVTKICQVFERFAGRRMMVEWVALGLGDGLGAGLGRVEWP